MPRNDHRGSRGPQRHRRALIAAAICVALASAHCERSTPEAPTIEPPVASAAVASAAGGASSHEGDGERSIHRVLPYPRGRWRLAAPEDLNHVLLWFSHILIRYDGVLDPTVSFCPFDWMSVPPPSQLTRDAALQLAQRIADEAASGSVPFAELAATYSEDMTSADRGGSLGGVTASWLSLWRQILDALQVLKPGQTSPVIETPYGFHILQRHAPPPEQIVSGSHIVIAHDDAQILRAALARGNPPFRSRAQAEALARDIYERARQNPAAFPELVQRYSEHRDAEAAGDMGQWSTREPLAPAREIETLAGLRVGEVAPPIDTYLGYQILMRTENRERPEFAHQAIEALFDPHAPEGGVESEQAARERALTLSERVAREPQLFDALRAEYCCAPTQVWREGRAEPALQAGLSGLKFGEIAAAPVRTVVSFAILRRIDPGSVVREPVRFELPANPAPDVDAFLSWGLDSNAATWVLRTLGGAGDELRLSAERSAALRAIHALEAGAGTGGERVQVAARIERQVKALLDPGEYQRYRDLASRLIERAVLDPENSVTLPTPEAAAVR